MTYLDSHKYKSDLYDTELEEQTIIPSSSARIVKMKSALSEFLILITDDNYVSVRNVPYFTDFVYGRADEKEVITSADYVSSSQFLALGMANGMVKLWSIPQTLSSEGAPLLFYTMNENYHLSGHEAPVYSLAFSPDGKYLASAAEDGAIFIRELNGRNEIISVLEINKKLRVPVIFTNDSTQLISAKTEKKIVLRDFNGNAEKTIKTKGKIQTMSLSSDGTTLFVLCDDNKIYFYDLETCTEIGYVPPFRLEKLTDFKFSGDETRLLVGHSDGTVFILNVAEVLLKPGAKPPTLGKGGISSLGDGDSRYRNDHSVELRAGYLTVQKPYVYGVTASAGYTNGKLLRPFYFGGLISYNTFAPVKIGFPGAPYKINGSNIILPNPYLTGLNFSIPFGFSMKPFKMKDIEFFVEAQCGMSVYSQDFHGYGYKDTYWGWMALFGTGVSWRRLSINLGTKYEGIFGSTKEYTSLFNFFAGVGYRIKVGND